MTDQQPLYPPPDRQPHDQQPWSGPPLLPDGPPTVPPGPTDHDGVGDAPLTADPVPGGPRTERGATLKTWIGAAAVAFLLGGVGVAVINRSSGATSTSATASGADGSTGSTDQGSAGATPGGQAASGRVGGGISGTIASIDGDGLTVTGTDGATTSVVTDDSTVVTTAVELSVSDVAVGDQISVMGTTSGTTVTAERIIDDGTDAAPLVGGPTGQPPTDGQTPPTDESGAQLTPPAGADGTFQGPAGRLGGLVRGEVTAVDGSTLTISGMDGTSYTVITSSTTTVTRMQTGSLADLAVGDEVTIMGAADADGTVTAARISEGSAFGGAFGPGAGGPPPGAPDAAGGPDADGTTPTTT